MSIGAKVQGLGLGAAREALQRLLTTVHERAVKGLSMSLVRTMWLVSDFKYPLQEFNPKPHGFS